MAVMLLATKFHVPAPRRQLVARTRLVEYLASNALKERNLTLVCAPAGFGKTTLLSQGAIRAQLSDPDSRIAWLSLDEADNDPLRFLSHLAAALHGVDADIGSGLMTLLDGSQTTETEPALIALINDMAESDKSIVLVLDDYHVIETRHVHDAVTFLIDHSPQQLHLAISSRSDPPLPLPRLRARDQVAELRAADLRFSPEEAGVFLNECMGLNLSAEQISALEARTEGWIAGLQLAALSLRGHDDVSGFIGAFTGSNRFVLDYLVEEVLRRQPESVRTFLMHTAVLNRLSGPLCDAVTGQGAGGAMLERLETANLFVVPLDDRRQWYRYHHLFAGVLRARVAHEEPDLSQVLHRRACDWYEQNDLLEDALDHAFAAEDFDRAATLLQMALPAIRRSRHDATILRWLSALPDSAVRGNPVLSAHYAWMMLASGDLDAVEHRLQDAERGLSVTSGAEDSTQDIVGQPYARGEEFRHLPITIAVYRASLAQATGDVDGTAAHARRAMELSGPGDHQPRAAAAGFLGLAAWAHGDLDTALPTFSEVAPSLRAAGNVADELASTIPLADMWLAKGRLTEARRVLEQSLTAASSRDDPLGPPTADLHVAISCMYSESGALDIATHHLQTSATLGEAASMPENRYRRFVAMARIRHISGDPDGAIGLLEDAERRFRRGFLPEVRPIAAMRARIRIAQGSLGDASDWARERNLTTRDPLNYLREFEHLTLARLLIAQHSTGSSDGSIGDVSDLLDRLLESAETSGRGGSVNEILVLQAMALQAGGRIESAFKSLERALIRTEPEGYTRLFLDEGAPMVALLRRAAGEGIAPRFIAQLLGTSEAAGGPPAASRQMGTMAMGLSERELQVLRLMDSYLTGPDIARQLFVSLNTVRTHTKHIFEKLQVSSRADAVRRAQELGLI
jgi:LuxR family maltose regulon positive regulatory protein